MILFHILLHLARRGERPYQTRLGFVADFCPICRDVRPFQLTETGVGPNVTGHFMECEDCRAVLGTSDGNYIFVATRRQPDLGLLMETTHPSLAVAYGERLQLEAELKKGKARLTPAERSRFLIEPLTALAFMVEKRFAVSSYVDTPAVLGCIATVLITSGLFGYATLNLSGRDEEQLLLATKIVLGLGIVFNVYQIYTGPYRFVRKRIAALAARALKPLGPGRKDIETCLAQCRQTNLRIGIVLKPEWLWVKLRSR